MALVSPGFLHHVVHSPDRLALVILGYKHSLCPNVTRDSVFNHCRRTDTAVITPCVKRTFSFAIVVICTLLTGCIGVTPMPKRTRTPQGPNRNLDLSFLKVGQTTRAELREKLQAIDTGFEDDRYFLGRWNESTWGGWAVLGLNETLQTTGRAWKNVNLLVEFDESGVVKGYERFPDRHLITRLAPVVDNTKFASSEHLNVSGGKFALTLVLTSEALEVEEQSGIKPRKYKIPVNEFSGRSTLSAGRADPNFILVTLHFASNLRKFGGPGGKKLKLEVTVPQLVKTLRCVSQRLVAVPES